MSVENKTIQVRRDTSANWSSNNPVPKAAEWCFETNTGVIKIGDGTNYYNDLTPIGKTNATTAELDILDGAVLTTAELNKLAGLTASKTELGYVEGVTSAIQTQINAKFDKSDVQTSFGSTLSDEKTASEKLIKNSLDEKQDNITVANTVLKKGVISSTDIAGKNNDGRKYTEPKTYADVIKYAHSVYDGSDFTTVGSPNITAEGIASGITKGDYLTTSEITFGQKVAIHFPKFKLNSYTFLDSEGGILGGHKSVSLYVESNGTLTLKLSSNGSTYDIGTIQSESGAISLDTEYWARLIFDGSKYSLKLSSDGINFEEVGSITSSDIIHTDTLYVGVGVVSDTRYDILADGSFDLKTLSVTVDGLDVFKGCKTGLDVITQDDYTIVGSPTITADGIVSEFSTSNYIMTPSIDFGNTFVIEGAFTTGQASGSGDTAEYEYVLGRGGALEGGINLAVRKNSVHLMLIDAEANVIYNDYKYVTSSNLQDFTRYKYQISFDGAEYRVKVIDMAGTVLLNQAVTSSSKIRGGKLAIGANRTDQVYDAFIGSIDLNAFRITVDTELSYQASFKIPYKVSADGVKYADLYYMDRIENMFKDYAVTPYTIIDKVSEAFILPLGSANSRIAPKILVDYYENGATSWEKYLDRTLIQRGSMTSGEAVVFACSDAYADTNYTLSCPYSAKSTTGFTPSATGEYIAIGKF